MTGSASRAAVALVPRPRSAGDFFSELIRNTQAARASRFAERDRWLRSVNIEGREELLFELEMLLRGIERYFNLHNLPIQRSRPVLTRDFHQELEHVRDAMSQLIRIARRLLDPTSDQKLVFRRFVESQLVDDRARRMLIEEELNQSTPQESLFVLRKSLESMRAVIDKLLMLPACSYSLYADVGNLAIREIVLNRYFRPFRPLEFRIEYDRIKSVPILDALNALPVADRRLFTIALLTLFRLLHYVSYVSSGGGVLEPRAGVILALVKSESTTLVGWLKSEFANKGRQKRHRVAAMRVARDIAKELDGALTELLSGQANGAGVTRDAAASLTQLFEEQVVFLAKNLGVKPSSGSSFAKLVARSDMAERLRLEWWACAELCGRAEIALKRESRENAGDAIANLRAFLNHFQEVSYQLLRYGDYAAFDRFSSIILEIGEVPGGPGARARLAEDCRLFSRTAANMFAAIGRRSDLPSRRFDRDKAERLVRKFSIRPKGEAT